MTNKFKYQWCPLAFVWYCWCFRLPMTNKFNINGVHWPSFGIVGVLGYRWSMLVLRLQLLPQLWCFVVAIAQGRLFWVTWSMHFGGCGGRDGSHTIYVSLHCWPCQYLCASKNMLKIFVTGFQGFYFDTSVVFSAILWGHLVVVHHGTVPLFKGCYYSW
jgi:hypothetical protein